MKAGIRTKRRHKINLSHVLPWCAGLPLLLGTWGYYLSYAKDAAISADVFVALHAKLGVAVNVILKPIYRAVILYGLNVDESRLDLGKPGYCQIETVRWIALFVKTSVFISIISMAACARYTRTRWRCTGIRF